MLPFRGMIRRKCIIHLREVLGSYFRLFNFLAFCTCHGFESKLISLQYTSLLVATNSSARSKHAFTPSDGKPPSSRALSELQMSLWSGQACSQILLLSQAQPHHVLPEFSAEEKLRGLRKETNCS